METTTQKNLASIKVKDKAWPKPALSHKIKQRQEVYLKPFALTVKHNLQVFNQVLVATGYLPVTEDNAKKFSYNGGYAYVKKGRFRYSAF